MHKKLVALMLIFGVLCSGCQKETSQFISPSGGMTQKPVIYETLTRYDESNQTLTVVTNDPFNDNDLVITVSEPRGLKADKTSVLTYGSGPATVSFRWSAVDQTKGANGVSTVTVTDSVGNYSTLSVRIFVQGLAVQANRPPSVDRTQTFFNPSTRQLTVVADDPDKADTFTISVTEPGGLDADKTSEVIKGPGPVRSVFTWTAVNTLSGGSGNSVVSVSDSHGGLDEFSVPISIPGTNRPPSINTSLTGYDAATRILNIAVTDPDQNDRITVKISKPQGLCPDRTEKNASISNSTENIKFYWAPEDILTGGKGYTGIQVTDQIGAAAFFTAEVTISGFSLEADSLYAVPVEIHTTTEDPVTIIVATGYPLNSFHTMKNVRLTVNKDARINPVSFNAGSPGGEPIDIDGFWAVMNPGSPFYIPPSGFINETNLVDYRIGLDFTLAPVNGDDVTNAQGMLFNFKMTFLKPGVYTLGFQTYFGEKRTFYTDKAGHEYFWGKNYNSYSGVPNTITVR